MEAEAISPAASLILPIYLNLGLALALASLDPRPATGFRLQLAKMFHTFAVGLIAMALLATFTVPRPKAGDGPRSAPKADDHHPRNAD